MTCQHYHYAILDSVPKFLLACAVIISIVSVYVCVFAIFQNVSHQSIGEHLNLFRVHPRHGRKMGDGEGGVKRVACVF